MNTPETPRAALRSEQEVHDLKQRIAFLARVFSRSYDMQVLPGDGWKCSLPPESAEALEEYILGKRESLDDLPADTFRPTHIFYREEHLSQWPLPAIMGLLRHEVGHANHTNYRHLFEGQKQAMQGGNLPSTWALTWNGLEDPWINNLEIADSQAVRENMRSFHEHALPQLVERINAQPPVLQLAQNITHYWFTGESIPNIQNKKVSEVFEQIKPYVDQYIAGETSEENFRLLQEKIWDKVKVLEPEGAHEQMMKRMMEAAANREFESGEGQGEPKDLFQQLREKLGRGRRRDPLDQELQQQMPQNLKQELAKELETQQAACRARQRQKQQRGPQEEIPTNQPMIEDLDISKLPKSARQRLQQVIKALPKDLRKRLEEEAGRRLDNKQTEAIKDRLPPSVKMEKNKAGQNQLTPDFVDQKDAKEKEKQVQAIVREVEERERRQAEEEARRMEAEAQRQAKEAEQRSFEQRMIQAGFDPENPEEVNSFRTYQAIEQSTRQQAANFVRIIERYLPKKESYGYGGEFYTGPKIDWSKVPTKIPIGKYDIFQRREIREAPEARLYVWLLIDRSGSMGLNHKMDESLKTAVFFARVLRYFDVPLSIKFFGQQLDELLDFKQNYDDPKERVKPRLIELSDASGRWTDLSQGLIKVKEEMAQAKREFPGSVGAVFVISDGEANSGIIDDQLKALIEEMQKSLLVYGFDLSGTGEVKDYFGDTYGVAVRRFDDLPKEAFKALRVTLERMVKQRKIV